MAKDATNLAAVLHAKATDLVLEERPVPSPGPGEVLIRNHAVAVNPADWKRQATGMLITSYPLILGADCAGVVAAVGPDVTALKPGDRVSGFVDAFATGLDDHAAFQTYSICRAAHATPLPDAVSFAQGATLGTGIATAAVALFDVLGFPLPLPSAGPGTTTTQSAPAAAVLLVWGGASVVGMAAIQLARLAGLTVYATASPKHHAYLRSLGASVLVDYRSASAVEDLVSAAEREGKEISYALNAVPTAETLSSTVRVLLPRSKSAGAGAGARKLATVAPWPEDELAPLPEGIEVEMVRGDALWHRRSDLAAWLAEGGRLTGWLERGEFVPAPCRVVEGGLAGLQMALDEVRKGVSGEKVVVEL